MAAIAAILLIVAALSRRRFAGGRGWFVFGSLAGILIVVNGLYFLNVIPPLPLSLKEAGVYHSIVAKGPGDYTATIEPHTNALASIDFPARFFAFTETVHITPGRWRVNVETQTGRLIGRLNFNAVVQNEGPALLQEIIS